MTNRIIRSISVFFLLLILFSACGKPAGVPIEGAFQYASFRDIPGVTEGEIQAVEALQKQGGTLIYATLLSTEAFKYEDGELGGFAVLLCDWLAGFFGIPFKVEIHDLSDILSELKTGGISFGAIAATEDRLETYYMTAPIIHRSVEVMRLHGRPSPDEIVLSRPVRYVFTEGGITIDSVTAALAPGSFEAIIVRNHEAAYQMLESGEADAVIGINIMEAAFDSYGGVVTEDFLPLTVTAVSLAAHDPALEPIISVVTKALDAGFYKHLTELYRQGYQDYKKNKFFMQLSEEERAYMRDTPVIPFAAQFMSYPVSFYNANVKKWEGIVFDVLDEMEKLTGFTFKLANDEKTDLPELMNLLESGTALIMPNLIKSDERRERFIWSNTMYLLDRFALLSKRSYPNIELNDIPFARVGYPRGSAFSDLFRSWFPDALNSVEYGSTDDAFMALERGEVDLVMSTLSRLTALTNYYELSDYKANYIFSAAFEDSFGLNKDQTVLSSIIDKALPLIDTSRIVEQWKTRTYNIETMRLRAQRPWLFGSLALILCVLVLLVVFFVRSRLAGKRLEKLVSERTHALELQTATLNTLFDSIPDLIFTKDLDFHFLQCNKSFLDHFGCRKEDTIGKIDKEALRLSVETAQGFLEWDKRVISENQTFAFEEPIPRFDGTNPIYETIKSPLVLDGKVVGILGVARDITKRKEIESELALQTAILTTLFDSIPAFIFAKDVNFCYLQCNKSFLAHMGFSKEDVIGKNDIDGFKEDPALVEGWWVWDRKVINEGKVFMIEERIPGANGTSPLYETIKAPLVLDGKIIGLLGISHDITERKEMEEAALAASRSKSAFLAQMSHEIRTPLNSIIGFSELAIDGETSEKTRDYFAKIQTNAEWLLQIINDILDISKIESGKMELENIPFDMHELFESCRTLIMPKADEKGIKLLFYAEPSVGKMPLGDPTRLRQVFVNLLSNAVKFTNSGTVKVLTEIKEKDEKTVAFHFEIKDTGIGMTEDQIKRIFEPFIQAETGTTRKYGGTGLGLAISKNFIELMGGALSVESIPGIGSKFSFDLKFDTIDVNGYERSELKAVLDEIEKPLFDGEVLLCEDNLMNQQVICEHFERVGLKTVVAENGKIGVEMVQGRRERGDRQFDLIFMDIHMPVMDGVEAAVKIVGLEIGVPIIAMTANIMSSDMEVYKQSGMSDCIGKPFTSQELWRCLLKYLSPVNREGKNISGNNTQVEEDLKFQRELKLMFVRTNQGKYEEIEEALKEGDVTLANRLAHNIKTNAGQIKKTDLQQAANVVEQMLKTGKNMVTVEQMKKLHTELKKTLDEFHPLLQEAAAQAGGKEVSALEPEKARELFEKLEPLLERGNPESLKFIGELRAAAGTERLIQQIEDFYFDAAVVTLGELREKLG
jgi:PAS domain S-box-containing protein